MAGTYASAHVEGLERLKSTLGNLPADLAEIAPLDAAQVIGTEAKSRAPKRTGFLAGSWSAKSESGTLTFGFGAPYAGPINFGVGPRKGLRGPHNIKRTEFFTGAVNDKREEWLQKYVPPIEEAVSKVKGA
jgi:hypothetical protein